MNDRKLQVLFIPSWYPNKNRPMLGIFVKRHAAALAKLCNVSAVFVYASTEDSVEETTEDGVYTLRLGYKKVESNLPFVSIILKANRYFSAWKKALRLYKQKMGTPDIVNLHIIIPAANVARYVRKKWKVPYVITEQWTGYFPEDGRYKGGWMKLMTERAVKEAGAVTTVSNDLKNQMLKCGLSNEYHVISNIVDVDLFKITESPAKQDKVRFIHVSTLDDAQKNVSGIIRAFKRAHVDFPLTELVMVGDTNGIEDLVKLGEGTNEAIKFVGRKVKKELVELLQNSDAFVLYSNYETQAIVLLEALCCGIPVIATKAGGISEYVTAKNGILIEPRNDEQLYNAMVAIVKDRNKFGNPAAIRVSVVDKVNADTIAEQFMNVYSKVLNRK